MYLAVDSHHPNNWLDGLLQTIEAASDVHWFALVDGVFDHDRKPFASSVPKVPLYGQTGSLYELLPVSPYLLQLDRHAGASLRDLVTRVGAHCQGRPMLSFVASWQPADELVRVWQPCLQPVIEEDGSRYLLRFADTRVLPALPGAMNPAAWAQLTAPLMHWCYVDREGALQTLWLSESHVEPARYQSAQLVLSMSDIDRMVDAAMPDAIVDLMERMSPGTLPDTGKAQVYRLVAQASTLAKANGVHATPDVVQLATYALATCGIGLTEPKLLALLDNPGRAPGELQEFLRGAQHVATET